MASPALAAPTDEDELRMQQMFERQRSGQPGALQFQAGAPPPAQPPPAQQGPVQPALGQASQQAGAGPTDIDPGIGRKVGMESAEAVKTAPPEKKDEINKELNETFGDDAVERAYNDAIKRLGGEKKFDPKLDKQDWGLFLMDFGMRMMAASNSWDSQLGGAIGTAGVGAMGALQERQATERQGVEDYNQQMRTEARALAEMQQEGREAPDITWTRQGGMTWNPDSRQYELVRGPDGKPMQPGLTPGQGARGFASDRSRSALERAGYSPEEAAEIEAGGLTNSEIREAARKAWTTAMDKGDDIISPVDGKLKYPSDFTKEERTKWREEYFDEVRGGFGTPGRRQGPALQPSAGSTGGSLPPPPWERER